jgi:hypothetical protein
MVIARGACQICLVREISSCAACGSAPPRTAVHSSAHPTPARAHCTSMDPSPAPIDGTVPDAAAAAAAAALVALPQPAAAAAGEAQRVQWNVHRCAGGRWAHTVYPGVARCCVCLRYVDSCRFLRCRRGHGARSAVLQVRSVVRAQQHARQVATPAAHSTVPVRCAERLCSRRSCCVEADTQAARRV